MLYSKSYYSKENRKIRSDRARHAVSCRKDRRKENTDLIAEEQTHFHTITVKNEISGKVTVVTTHPGTRRNNILIKVDGVEWKTCGMIAAEQLIIRSLFAAK